MSEGFSREETRELLATLIERLNDMEDIGSDAYNELLLRINRLEFKNR